MMRRDKFIVELASNIALSLGYEWDGLPEMVANSKNGNRIPPKTDFIQAAETAFVMVQHSGEI